MTKQSTASRMGVNGKGYGIGERARATMSVLSRDELLALAWACVDQASTLRTTLEGKRAMDAIEDLYDAEALCDEEEEADAEPTLRMLRADLEAEARGES